MTKKAWTCHTCNVECPKHWTYCNGCNKTKQEIRAEAASIDSKKQKEAAANRKQATAKSKDVKVSPKADDKAAHKADKKQDTVTTDVDDADDGNNDVAPVDDVMVDLKDRENILVATIASLAGNNGKQATDQRTAWEQELIQVRHAITGRQPAKDQITKLTNALSNAEDKNSKIIKKIDEATTNLAEAAQAIEDLEKKKSLNEAQITDVKAKLAAAKQAYACE